MRLPTTETIKAGLNVDTPIAARIHAALRVCKSSALDPPNAIRAALNKVDAILGGHGVEYIQSAQDTMYSAQGIEYVNMGDTYAATILFDHARDSFLVDSWGNIVEQFPARFTE